MSKTQRCGPWRSIHIRALETVANELDELARKNDRSTSAEARRAIELHLKNSSDELGRATVDAGTVQRDDLSGNWIWSVRLEVAPAWFKTGVSKDEITARRDAADALAVLEKCRQIWARRYDNEKPPITPKEGKSNDNHKQQREGR